MQTIKQQLRQLCETTSVSGQENKASQIAMEFLKDYSDDVKIDKFGNVIAMKKSKNKNAKILMLDAHIDEIGMIITAIDDKGFLKVASCGGIDRRLLSAQEVTVHGTNKSLLGVIGSKPPHLEKDDEKKQVPAVEDIFIDIGLSKEQAEEFICLGDRVTINSTYNELLNDRISVKSLDDKAGVVTILEALRLLKGKELNVNLAVLFSVQEETGTTGAKIGAYNINPDMAIAVDVSFALTPDAKPNECGKMGDGVMIGVSALLDKKLSDKLISIAKEKEIKYQIEVLTGRSTGTNADPIITTRGGVTTGILSIPQKYMHTPIEVVDLKDIKSTASLIAEYALSIENERE